MVQLRAFKVKPNQLDTLIVQPMFADVVNDDGDVLTPSSEEGDWSLMDNVSSGEGRSILDLFGGQNQTRRRDATCKLIYTPVGKLSNRNIFTTKLYVASELCQPEFYQGDFADYEASLTGDKHAGNIFFQNILPFMEDVVRVDTFTNRWFGDITRQADPLGVWSWNKYNGIFTHIAKYIASGLIPARQTFAIPAGAGTDGVLTPQQGYNILYTAWRKQDQIMRTMPPGQKAFYVDQGVFDAYEDYLRQSNPGYVTIIERQGLSTTLQFKSIQVRVKPWDAVLAALNGGVESHAVILTLKGNFIYGYDSNYGEGRGMNEAIRVFWDELSMQWYYNIFWKAGTEIAAPQHIVVGATDNTVAGDLP